MARSLANKYAFTGVDLSPIQIKRARLVAPKSHFVCADMTKVDFEESSFDAIIAMWSIIHLPLDEQPALFKAIAKWLVPSGIFVTTLGDGAWTGIEDDWLGVQGSPMYFSHADAPTYRQWLLDAGLKVIEEGFISEPTGECRHSLFITERSS